MIAEEHCIYVGIIGDAVAEVSWRSVDGPRTERLTSSSKFMVTIYRHVNFNVRVKMLSNTRNIEPFDTRNIEPFDDLLTGHEELTGGMFVWDGRQLHINCEPDWEMTL